MKQKKVIVLCKIIKSFVKNGLIFIFILTLTACSPKEETELIHNDTAASSDTIENDSIESSDAVLNTDNSTIESAAETIPGYPRILKPTTKWIEFAYQSENIYCIWTGEKFGFMNDEGKEITSYVYDNASPFNEGLACVMKEGKYGFINADGIEIIPLIYDNANSFSEGLAYFEINDKYGFMNKDEEEVFLLDCDSISSFKEGMAFYSVNGKYGFIDAAGTIVIDNIYDDVSFFERGLAVVQKGIYVGVIDKAGNEILPIIYTSASINESYIVIMKDDVIDYYDFSGKKIYNNDGQIVQINDDHYIYTIDEKSGVSDKYGNNVLPPVYEQIEYIENSNFFIVCKDEKYGIIDDKGELKVPFMYDGIYTPYNKSSINKITYVNVRLNNKSGILSLNNFTESISPVYDRINTFYEGYAIAYDNDGYGIINEYGNVILPFGTYDYIFSISDKLICLNKDDNYYLANNSGEIISEKIYDYIYQYSKAGDFQIFEKNGKKGLIDNNGLEILSARYNSISNNKVLFNSGNSFIATNYKDVIKNYIIVVGESENIALSEVVLTNQITPRIKEYHDHVQKSSHTTELSSWTISDTLQTTKLFNVDNFEVPILYYYAESAIRLNFPWSNSAFYTIENNQIKELVSGYECGGAIRGDYVQLYREKETGNIYLGTRGLHGGFGGYSYIYNIHLDNDDTSNLYLQWIEQDRKYFAYNNDFLLENAHLFYVDWIALTKENILEYEYMRVYYVNGSLVSVEDFNMVLDQYYLVPMNLNYWTEQ